MLAGISTACFYPELTERAFAWLADNAVEATEIFVNSTSELEDAYLRELRRMAQDSGMRILSMHPFTSGLEPLLFFSDYRRRFEDGVELYKHYFHALNELGAEILVFHGNRRESTRSHHEYFDLFGELARAGKAMGVTVAQENVPRCTGYCPHFFAEMAAYLPDARFVLDTKQCIRAGYNLTEMVEAMGDRIVHVHLSDHNAQSDCLPVGSGDLDLPALLGRLRAAGFDGGVLLELYRDNYGDVSELLDSYRQMWTQIHRENGKKSLA